MYTRSADYYDACYGFRDYEAGAAAVLDVVAELRPGASSLLDVGCGTGRHLEHWQRDLDVEGLDLNAQLLEVARRRCPDVPLHQADMTSFELGRRFDVVTCLFGSVGYLRTVDRLRAAVATMARHLRPGGLLVLEPWFTPETFWVDHLVANTVDTPALKISWMYLTALREGLSVLDIHYQVGTAQGIDQFHEVHELGLYTHEDHVAALHDVGLEPGHRQDAAFPRGLYTGRAGS